jgi:hypothetical protein
VIPLCEIHDRIDARAGEHLDLLGDLIRRPSRTGHLDEVGRFADHLVGVLTDTQAPARGAIASLAASNYEQGVLWAKELVAPVLLGTDPAPSLQFAPASSTFR